MENVKNENMERRKQNRFTAYPLVLASVLSKLKSLIAHNALEVSEPDYVRGLCRH